MKLIELKVKLIKKVIQKLKVKFGLNNQKKKEKEKIWSFYIIFRIFLFSQHIIFKLKNLVIFVHK